MIFMTKADSVEVIRDNANMTRTDVAHVFTQGKPTDRGGHHDRTPPGYDLQAIITTEEMS